MTDSPAAPDRTTTGETASGLIRNALQILGGMRVEVALIFRDDSPLADDVDAMARLLGNALAKLDGASGPPTTTGDPQWVP